MSRDKLYFAVIVLVTIFAWGATVQGDETGSTEKRAVFAKLLDGYAACCEYKSMLRDSRSEKLRQKAEISCLKAAYLRNYKPMIIDRLIETNVLPKAYKVQYVVNTMFYDLLRRETTTHHAVMPSAYMASEQVNAK